MFRKPKVALLLETSTHFGRGLLRGIIRYSRLHGPWSLYMSAGDFEQGLPSRVGFTGVIGRICALSEAADIRAKGLPTVVIEPGAAELAATDDLNGFCEIRANACAIADMVADHFLGKGLRSFAFCGFENAPWSQLREEAFSQRVADKGFPCCTHRINLRNWMRHGDWIRSWGREQSRLIVWLKSLSRLTGLMACNDMCGRRVLETCADAGMRVPMNVAVVSVDNDDLICELSDPPLSSVALDVERAGYEAALLLDALMSGREDGRKHVVSVNPLWVVARRSSDLIVEDDPLVSEALHFINDRAGAGIGVPDIVHKAGVSRRTLERKFVHAIGRSILAEITRSRLRRAKCLLQETPLPVCRVATEAGFANTRMFNRIFRRAEGLPPSAFRRQLRGTANQQATKADAN